MPATPFDSTLLRDLFPGAEVSRLFSDNAEVRAMMLVEGTLAKVQGAAGVIPEISAQAIHRASHELQIDPGGLAKATGINGVCVPALVAAFRSQMQAPEHAQFLHWGATSQDIIDTALMLRLRQVLAHFDTGLTDMLRGFAALAETHARTPMLARTYGQDATLTSFGAQVADWGYPLLALRAELAPLRTEGLWVSLSGAAGTASELGANPQALRAELAKALGLTDPGRSWHTDRSPVTRIAAWITRTSAALGKIAEDLLLATQSAQGEVTLGGGGSSSTMPQKQNPVAPSAMLALSRHAVQLNTTLQSAASARQQRDGAAWFTEWLTFPQLCLSLTAALEHGRTLANSLHPNVPRMTQVIAASRGLIHAEALSFALTAKMSRPDAQTAVKDLCTNLHPQETLPDKAFATWPDLPQDLFDPETSMGTAPQHAQNFVQAART